jgi:hypothetical protein
MRAEGVTQCQVRNDKWFFFTWTIVNMDPILQPYIGSSFQSQVRNDTYPSPLHTAELFKRVHTHAGGSKCNQSLQSFVMETNRIQLALAGMQNRTFGPCLATH